MKKISAIIIAALLILTAVLDKPYEEKPLPPADLENTLPDMLAAEQKADKPEPVIYVPVRINRPEPERTSLGKFTVTAYCPCKKCCGKWSNPDKPVTASGKPAVEGVTVGADWDTIPPGTRIYIEGVGERVVQDKPAKWIVKRYNGKMLDLYFAKHEDAVRFGKQELEVWIIK